jgi:hypothetical protein
LFVFDFKKEKPMKKSLINYKNDIEKARNNDEDRLVFTGNKERYNILINSLIDSSSKYIYIFSNNFNMIASDIVFFKHFEQLLNDNSLEIKILIEDTHKNKLLKKNLKKYNNTLNNSFVFLSVEDRFLIDLYFSDVCDYALYFISVDEKSYLIDNTNEDFKSVTSFFDKKLSKQLKNLFMDFFNELS